MSKVMNLSDANNRHLREVLEELMLIRATARLEKRPVHGAIRERCQLLGKNKHPSMINAMLEQIRRKTLCEHELLKCVATYNELVRGELEMIRDGEVLVSDTRIVRPMMVEEVLARMRSTSLPTIKSQ